MFVYYRFESCHRDARDVSIDRLSCRLAKAAFFVLCEVCTKAVRKALQSSSTPGASRPQIVQ